MKRNKIRASDFMRLKKNGRRWTMLTAYDAGTAKLLEDSNIDMILVGDSLGMVVLGYESTREVSMDEMIHHAKAVRRGAKNSFVIGDMPFSAVNKGVKHAVASARRFTNEAGCDAVKLEWSPDAKLIAAALAKAHVPVMGHVGLTPQTATKQNGYRAQGQEASGAYKIFESALAFENLRAFSVLLECVPLPVTKAITQALKVPTLGIGAGFHCDGQVLVFHDLVGLFTKFKTRFAKRYLDADSLFKKAVHSYKQEVLSKKFPLKRHSFEMSLAEQKIFKKMIASKKGSKK